jgi:hypothetical protein
LFSPFPPREGGRGVRFFAHARPAYRRDALQHASKISHNLAVREADYRDAHRSERGRSRGVVLDLSVVNRAVQFDRERRGVAVEIHNESADDLLASEVEPDPVSPDARPHDALFRCEFASQFERELFLLGRHTLPANDVPNALGARRT